MPPDPFSLSPLSPEPGRRVKFDEGRGREQAASPAVTLPRRTPVPPTTDPPAHLRLAARPRTPPRQLNPYPAEARAAPAQRTLKVAGSDEEITAKEVDGEEKKIKGQGMWKGSGKDSHGGKGKGTGRTKEFTPWWKKMERSRGKGFEKRKGK